MTTIEFKFSIDDKVKVVPIEQVGVISMCAIDDGGKQYHVKTGNDGQWWPERLLEKQ